MRVACSIVLLLALAASASAQVPDPIEDDELEVAPDGDLARAAVGRGEILPLWALLPRVLALFPGEVLDIELDLYDDGSFEEYEFEILTPDGRLIEVDVDAATGEVTEVGPEDFDDED